VNVLNGMTGAFIIEGKHYDDALDDAYGSYLLKDEEIWKPWKASDERSQKILVLNQLGTGLNALIGGGSGDPRDVDFSVNGRLRPTLKMQPGEVQLWRIVNSSGRTAAYFMPPDTMGPGLAWRQLAQDGVQFAFANYQWSENRPFYMAPANRVDLLVKAPNAPGKFGVRVQNVMSRSSVQPIPIKPAPGESRTEEAMPGTILLTVVVEGPPPRRDNQSTEMPFLGNTPDKPKFPVQPKFLQDITPKELRESNDIKRTLEFNSKKPKTAHQHTINDIQFGDPPAHLDIALGAVEEWTVKNRTNMLESELNSNIDHPLHIHINPFQVAEFFDPNENLINPQTGKLVAVLEGTTTVAVPLYVTDMENLSKDPTLALRQCYIAPDNEATWSVSGARKIRLDSVTRKFLVSDDSCEPQTPPEWKSVWWDVFAIPAGRQISPGKVIPGFYKMRSRFVDYPGLYVMHCHILIHEDRGMMYAVEVLRRTARPHH
jgi:FtsP/CotA-like multicopper oxidase with cupredoxin domain